MHFRRSIYQRYLISYLLQLGLVLGLLLVDDVYHVSMQGNSYAVQTEQIDEQYHSSNADLYGWPLPIHISLPSFLTFQIIGVNPVAYTNSLQARYSQWQSNSLVSLNELRRSLSSKTIPKYSSKEDAPTVLG